MFAKTIKKSPHKSQFWYDKSWENIAYIDIEKEKHVWLCECVFFLCVSVCVTERETY